MPSSTSSTSLRLVMVPSLRRLAADRESLRVPRSAETPWGRGRIAAIDRAYRTRCARYASSYVDPMVSPDATAATLRLIAR